MPTAYILSNINTLFELPVISATMLSVSFSYAIAVYGLIWCSEGYYF